MDRAGLFLVKKAGLVRVTFFNKQRLEARVVYFNEHDDVALLSVHTPFPLTPMTFADSDNLQTGNVIYTLSKSQWIQGSLSEGAIQGVGTEEINQQPHVTFLQLSFRAYKGDSGSPVLNQEGKLIGIIAAGEIFKDVTYAIASNVVWGSYQKYLASLEPQKS